MSTSQKRLYHQYRPQVGASFIPSFISFPPLIFSFLQVVQLLRQSVSSSCPPVCFDPSHSIFLLTSSSLCQSCSLREKKKSFRLSGRGGFGHHPHSLFKLPTILVTLTCVCFTFASSSPPTTSFLLVYFIQTVFTSSSKKGATFFL